MDALAEFQQLVMDVNELAHRFDPVEISSDALIVTAADSPILERTPARPNLTELGTTGQTNYAGMIRDDYNLDLRGKMGLRTYDRMRKSDGQVRATLRLVKTPVLAARWYVEPASESNRDAKIAQHIEDNLFKWMTKSWNHLLTEILLSLDYGFYVFEKVFDMREGKVIWKKFAPRHPLDVSRWKWDAHGGVEGVYMLPQMTAQETFIPIDKLAIFTFEEEAGNVEGVSVLRSAYKHWFYKENLYKIDAIAKERHGIGIPYVQLPPNFTQADLAKADEIGRNLRTNEKAHVTIPPNYEIGFIKLEGSPVDALASAEHHDLMIARNILGQFINSPQGTSQEDQQELFLKATRYIADMIRDVFNKYCIPQIVQWNWGDNVEYPELRVRRIGDTVDWRTISFAIRNFVGAGLLRPDDPLEDWIRKEMDLPKADPNSVRIIVAPVSDGTIPDGQPDTNPGPGGPKAVETRQNGGIGDIRNFAQGKGGADLTAAKGGLPRQSTTQGMKSARSTGSSQVGRDKSGG